jgi:hypothetical protein
MKTLIVVSCSWGCGEWDHQGNHELVISHPGITEYLNNSFKVVNLSRAGNSNWQICYTLHNYLMTNPHQDFEIIVIQTDIARRSLAEKYLDLELVFKKTHNLESLYTELSEICYHKLAYLAKLANTKIHLVGGLTDLSTDILSLSEFGDLVVLCDSWIKLLYNAHTPSLIPLRLDPELLTATKEYNRYDLFEQVVEYSDKNFLKLQELYESEFFGPAFGDFHPSRLSHKLLSEHIINYFKDIK